jgi:hypothetical protein
MTSLGTVRPKLMAPTIDKAVMPLPMASTSGAAVVAGSAPTCSRPLAMRKL